MRYPSNNLYVMDGEKDGQTKINGQADSIIPSTFSMFRDGVVVLSDSSDNFCYLGSRLEFFIAEFLSILKNISAPAVDC